MTLQDVFDETLHHLQAQGRRAIEKGICRYRTTDSLRCAVGYWIPDEAYRPSLEMHSCDTLRVRKALPADLRTEDMVLLLRAFQALHDDRRSWNPLPGGGLSEEGYQQANSIAARFGLTGVAR